MSENKKKDFGKCDFCSEDAAFLVPGLKTGKVCDQHRSTLERIASEKQTSLSQTYFYYEKGGR